MNGLGYRSWPDRLVIGPKGFFKWIEFKRPVLGKLSDGQVDLFEELSCMGHPVEVHDDFKVALLSLELDLRKHKIIK